MAFTLTTQPGDTTHAVVLTCLNTQDSTPATGVTKTYASDNTSVCTVDASSGALNPVGIGTANITGTGVRGSFTHTDTGVVTVSADPNTGDFFVRLDIAQ